MTKKTEAKGVAPKGAIIVGQPAPVGSVAAAAEGEGVRPRKRGPGVQIYISQHIKDYLIDFSATHGVNMKHFADAALAAAFMKVGIDVELRNSK